MKIILRKNENHSIHSVLSIEGRISNLVYFVITVYVNYPIVEVNRANQNLIWPNRKYMKTLQ